MTLEQQLANREQRFALEFWDKGYIMTMNPTCRTLDWVQASRLANKHKISEHSLDRDGGLHIEADGAMYWISSLASHNIYAITRMPNE